jgi:O-antigen/teichoic acid export membrane protein
LNTLNSFLPALSSILQRAVGIFVVYLCSKLLGDTDFADFAIGKATINNFIIASNAGAVILSTKLHSNIKLGNITEMTLGGVYTSFAVYVVLFFLLFNLFIIFSFEDVRAILSINVMSVVFIFTAYNSFEYGKSIAYNNIFSYIKNSLLSVIISVPLVFISINLFDYYGAVIAFLIFPFSMSILLRYNSDRVSLKTPGKSHLKIFWNSGIKNQFSGLLNVLGILFMYYYLRHVVEDIKGVKYLDILILFQGLVLLVTASFSTVLLPRLIRSKSGLYSVMAKSFMSIMLALTFFLIFKSKITSVFNIGNVPDTAYFIFLSSSIVLGVKKNLAQVFLSEDMEGKILFADILWLTTLLIAFYAIDVIDISGVAMCYLFSHIAHLFVYLILLFRKRENFSNYS